MQEETLIRTDDFCLHHQVAYSFISSLQQSGLIEIVQIDEQSFLHQEELCKLERFVRLHYELDINLEGIEAVSNLLERVAQMQQEIAVLKNRLGLYEQI